MSELKDAGVRRLTLRAFELLADSFKEDGEDENVVYSALRKVLTVLDSKNPERCDGTFRRVCVALDLPEDAHESEVLSILGSLKDCTLLELLK